MVATTLQPVYTASPTTPPSPAQIDPNTPLAELRSIKLDWLEKAISMGYAAMLWEVLKWLGTPEQSMKAKGADAVEAERRKLLSELLVGVEI